MNPIALRMRFRTELPDRLDRWAPELYRRLRPREFPTRHLPEKEALSKSAAAERAYAGKFAQRIRSTFRRPDGGGLLVPLSYMPLAKNIRQVASARRHAARRGLSVGIAKGNVREERHFVGQRKGPWHPWLWGRIDRAREVGALQPSELWNLYFEATAESPSDETAPAGPVPPTKLDSWKRRLLEYGVACAETSRPTPFLRDRLRTWEENLGFPTDRPVLGLHVRRGDAASEDLERHNRASHALADYLETADEICDRYEIRTLYLSTESQKEVDRARALRPQYDILCLPHDRRLFPRIEQTDLFIEDAALQQPSLVEPLALSALADLHFLSRCQGFIGTLNSEFSMLGWLLCVGIQQRIVPYVDLVTWRELRAFQGRLDFWMDPPEFI